MKLFCFVIVLCCFFCTQISSQSVTQYASDNEWAKVPNLDENWVRLEKRMNHKIHTYLPKDGAVVLVYLKVKFGFTSQQHQVHFARFDSKNKTFRFRDLDNCEVEDIIAWAKITKPL